MMEYKSYTAKVEYDDDAGVFFGEVIDLRDVITFEGDTTEQLRKAFHDSVDDYFAFCRERNEEPEKSFSGKFMVRVGSSLHRKIHKRAKLADKSLNSWIGDALSEAVTDED